MYGLCHSCYVVIHIIYYLTVQFYLKFKYHYHYICEIYTTLVFSRLQYYFLFHILVFYEIFICILSHIIPVVVSWYFTHLQHSNVLLQFPIRLTF